MTELRAVSKDSTKRYIIFQLTAID